MILLLFFFQTVFSTVSSLFEPFLKRVYSSVDLWVTKKNRLPETIEPDAVTYLFDPEGAEAFQMSA